jgi:hypothetical protein
MASKNVAHNGEEITRNPHGFDTAEQDRRTPHLAVPASCILSPCPNTHLQLIVQVFNFFVKYQTLINIYIYFFL